MKQLLFILLLIPIIGFGQVKLSKNHHFKYYHGDGWYSFDGVHKIKLKECAEADSVIDATIKFHADDDLPTDSFTTVVPTIKDKPEEMPIWTFDTLVSPKSTILSADYSKQFWMERSAFISLEDIEEYIEWCKNKAPKDTMKNGSFIMGITHYIEDDVIFNKEPTFLGFYKWLKKKNDETSNN